MKCLGNNSYLSELFLAGNCNFHCKTHSDIPSRVARELSNVSTVQPRFPMLTINQILGPQSVQFAKQHYGDERLCLIGKRKGKRKKRAFITHILTIVYIFLHPNG